MEHHNLDVYPIPKDKAALYINEPWLIDYSILNMENLGDIRVPESKEDNVRVYIPLDINATAILRRLKLIIVRYGEANDNNEIYFQMEVDALISQVEIYDQIWYVRHIPTNKKHSKEAIELVRAIVAELEEIPDGCAEIFPFETIDILREEYLSV